MLALDDVEPPNYKNVEEGKSIDIECGKTDILRGDNITWSKGEERNLKSRQRFTVNDIGSLHINETKKTDIGFYNCTRTEKRMEKTGHIF